MANRTCPVCDEAFSGRVDKVYCSRRCMQRAASRRWDARSRGAAAADEFRCLGCGSLIVSGSGRPRWCSDTCRSTAVRSAKRERAKVVHAERACDTCGAGFLPGRSDALYCSKRCRRRAYKRRHPEVVAEERRRYRERHGNPKYGEARRAADQRRRARRRGARVESFTRADIVARDGWRCGLCTRKVDPSLAWPHPMSASTDHLVPLSLDGEHSLRNVQLAHLTCNESKGTKPAGEQLRLI